MQETQNKLSRSDFSPMELDLRSSTEGEHYKQHFEVGTYRCAHCSALLFSSGDKFRATKGRLPAWRRAIKGAVKIKEDCSYGYARNCVECAQCGLHLGVLTNDGKETGDTDPQAGYRYSILSVSLIFDETVTGNAADVPDEIYEVLPNVGEDFPSLDTGKKCEPAQDISKGKMPSPLIDDSIHKPPIKEHGVAISAPLSSTFWWAHVSLLCAPLVVAVWLGLRSEK